MYEKKQQSNKTQTHEVCLMSGGENKAQSYFDKAGGVSDKKDKGTTARHGRFSNEPEFTRREAMKFVNKGQPEDGYLIILQECFEGTVWLMPFRRRQPK
jgi:hypothetical protein